MLQKWYVIVNPSSGNGTSKKKWPLIFKELKKQQINFEYDFTSYKKHSTKLVQNAIKNGFKKFICIGGDGTIHNIVNGILIANPNNIKDIKIGVIPVGTGNDWIKTYGISKNYKKAIYTIKNECTTAQDIGKISMLNTNKTIYFNNLAGIGFDGYVVHKVNSFKNLGFLAYLTAAIVGIITYKKTTLQINFNNIQLKGSSLLVLIGICTYCGGGMRLTQNPNPKDALFDITYLKTISLLTLLLNIPNLFNGKITQNRLLKNYKTSTLHIKVLSKEATYIQADGESIDVENLNISILPNALNFIIPN